MDGSNAQQRSGGHPEEMLLGNLSPMQNKRPCQCGLPLWPVSGLKLTVFGWQPARRPAWSLKSSSLQRFITSPTMSTAYGLSWLPCFCCQRQPTWPQLRVSAACEFLFPVLPSTCHEPNQPGRRLQWDSTSFARGSWQTTGPSSTRGSLQHLSQHPGKVPSRLPDEHVNRKATAR